MRELATILYLEDDPYISEVTMLALVDIAGLSVRHCTRGADAIELYPEFRPDLLLFDVMLPDMDGIETLNRIRAAHGSETPVVFMTEKAQLPEQQTYLNLGALNVIVKPFDAMTLGDQLRKLWSTRN